MKTCRSCWLRLCFVTALIMFAPRPFTAQVIDKTKDIVGTQVQYKVILPKGYDPAKAYPAVLAFPGGPQSMDTVEGTLQRNWRQQAERLGYIVVIPAAPDGQLFFEGGDKVFPVFLEQLLGDYKIRDQKFHIAGVSNGGLSAFHIAASYPQYFWSVTGLPGYLLDASPEHIGALAKMCIYMYAGEMDPGWLESERKQSVQFRARGFTVDFSEERGQGHVMLTLEGEGASRLFKQFEQARHGCGK